MKGSRPPAWVALDGMFYPVFERDFALVERIFSTVLLKISHNRYRNEEIRQSRLIVDFYETASLDYEKVVPFRPLLGMNGSRICNDGDVVFRVDFDRMEVWTGAGGISKEIGEPASLAGTG
ncbi:hypothetical protein J2741_001467 [Methanolinea mesophila]|uniref:hypothetical protein n=1 Tax=Methanolinea mesophila TaxID=547055 RepID=UPI001AE64E05|nr:hypothetical protein [Methanolinea mesophila]MBP1928920.1 hypothetical protein [Methanolinea mesophila]